VRMKFSDRQQILVALAAMAAAASLLCAGLRGARIDFVTAVVSTHPIAYYRLEATKGQSQVGTTAYKAVGGAESAEPGAPIGIAGNHYAKLNGTDAYIATTQAGGIGTDASMMAWVNLASLPSAAGHFFYVMGESQFGNDLDVQFENDNQLKFYTAAGGHLTFVPDPSTLVDQWHMIVVTLDTPSHTRVIYWDGKVVATDKGGGQPGKTSAFTIGASTVFTGRWFHGGIDEVALWNRALRAAEVATIYAAAKTNATSSGATSSGAASSGAAAAEPATGPFATTAKIEIDDANGPIKLKREEQIAFMFLSAIQNIENPCQVEAQHACTLEELLAGPKAANGWHIDRLKFDPRSDPNYSYSLSTNGMVWEAHANPKKPGLGGFYFVSNGMPSATAYYNPDGDASITSTELTGTSISGDSFETQ
jgi:Concanavalin A-like lectin/glucanases superfamily